MLNYSKITDLQKENKVSNREIAAYLKMSGVGYGKMLEKKTCTVSIIEMIAVFFKKPLSYFFDDFHLDITNEPTSPYYTECKNHNCIKQILELEKRVD